MKIKLWTIQNEKAYHKFIQTGIWRADPSYSIFDGEFCDAYDWLAAQMDMRIGSRPKGVEYPMWAWYQWEGERKRCDLRCGGYAKRGTRMLQVAFEIDDSQVLLSDFDGWHFVLSNSYLAANEQDFNSFYEKLEVGGFTHQDIIDFGKKHPLLEECRKKIMWSWDRIFNLESYTPDWDCPPDQKSIQATFWELKSEQVEKIEFFTAK